ncbi:MAG: LacI family DNA-binding transcriptional regulator [Eubacteriales bacterium]|nr:LacI family DNA-binding transcriptional regulator [Eubacteriales bacterium]
MGYNTPKRYAKWGRVEISELTRKPANIKDVAKHAGVSISTVSNVVNNTKRVSPKLTKMVQDSIQLLSYQANSTGRRLKTGKSQELVVIVPTPTSIFMPNLLKSIQNAAEAKGYYVSIFSSKGKLEREWNIIKRLHTQGISGIFLSSCADVDLTESQKYVEYLNSISSGHNPTHVICLEAAISNQLDAVVFNDAEGIAMTVSHLLGRGCKYFAHIATPLQYSMGKNRRRGFMSELLLNGCQVEEKLIVESDSYTCQSGYDAMKKLMETGLPIDAVVSGNDQIAIGAINYLKQQNIRIPQDIAVTGFNDNSPASLIMPSLTTIHVPKEEMGKCAFEQLNRRINGDKSGRLLIQLDGELIVRNSTDPDAITFWDMDW